MKNTIRVLLVILVVISMILPRIVELNKFTAADEPFWLLVGANYYYAVTHGEFENTVYEYHPAVTTMWIGTAAMLICASTSALKPASTLYCLARTSAQR